MTDPIDMLDETTGNARIHAAKTKEDVRAVIKAGGDINLRNRDGLALVHLTYVPEVMQELVDRKADLDATMPYEFLSETIRITRLHKLVQREMLSTDETGRMIDILLLGNASLEGMTFPYDRAILSRKNRLLAAKQKEAPRQNASGPLSLSMFQGRPAER